MLMRNSNAARSKLSRHQQQQEIASANPMGRVRASDGRLPAQAIARPDANQTDMLMRNAENTGAFKVYRASATTSDRIIRPHGPGRAGMDRCRSSGGLPGNANETDMLMRNTSTSAFRNRGLVGNNRITSDGRSRWAKSAWNGRSAACGQPRRAHRPPRSSVASPPTRRDAAPSSATAQLTQAMASFAPSAGTPTAPSLLDQTTSAPSSAANLLTASNHL